MRTELEVAAEVQKIDAYAEPRPALEAERMRAGLLGRMAERACLIEAFHRPPDGLRVRDAMQKQLALHSQQRRERRRERKPAPRLPALWIVAAGDPVRVRREFRFRQSAGWPTGCLWAPQGFGLRLIVVPQLPRERDTLLVRLMGAGATLRAVLTDLGALPTNAWERRAAGPWLAAPHFTIIERGAASTEDEELTMDAVRMYAESQRQAREEGRMEGILHLYARRLGRDLFAPEVATLRAHAQSLGAARLEDMVLEMNGPVLAAWLAERAIR